MRERQPRAVAILVIALALAPAVGLVYAGQLAVDFASGVHRSDALAQALSDSSLPALPRRTSGTDILVMGIDSRLDASGRPVPADAFGALHPSDGDVAGYSASVLMLVHFPTDGSRPTVTSIPREATVETAGFSGAGFRAKLKDAYGYGFAAQRTALTAAGTPYDEASYLAARDAGRRAEIATVTKLLGTVRIDHFVEVTMAAFYQAAQALTPASRCATRPVVDEAAQQAFILSVLHEVKQPASFTNPAAMKSVLEAAGRNLTVDSGMDLEQVTRDASWLSSGNLTYTTLASGGPARAANVTSVTTVGLNIAAATANVLPCAE
ncbi:LCP family protein [Sinomonas sp. G460-2]|uniref:LCP family protein n=1 Tax=Sinomonas sp. G460-2 TaxID=3393464 RepID=UPI0039F078EE